MTHENKPSAEPHKESEKKDEHEHPVHTVKIIIDNKTYEVKPGNYMVSQLKTIGHVAQAFELEEFLHGKLVPLPDVGSVTIKGGEKFVGHPKDNAAS